MTENKRFTFKNWNDYAEGDCIYYDDGEEMGSLDVLDTLNELHDETQFLKEECKHQQGQKMRLVAELKRLDYSEDDIRDIANGGVILND